MNMRYCSLALPLAVALIAGANVASAATFQYGSYSVANPQNIHILTPNNVFGGSGQITLHGSGANTGQQILAWCLDVYDFLQGSGTYTIGPLTTAGSGSPNPSLTTTQISQIGSLIGHGNAIINSSFNVSAAIQLAIWEVEYGNSFSFSGVTAGVSTLATTYLTYVAPLGLWSSPNYAVTLLSQSGNQNLAFATPIPEQETFPTPLPGAFALFAGGLSVIGFLSTRRRKRLMSKAVS